jgi:hypothetical protein
LRVGFDSPGCGQALTSSGLFFNRQTQEWAQIDGSAIELMGATGRGYAAASSGGRETV